MLDGPDLRSEERHPLQLAARASTDGESFRRAMVVNLSRKGAYVEGEIDLPHRSRVLVDIALGDECVRLRGRVAHPEEWPEHARRVGIGVEFVGRTSEAMAAIDAVLSSAPAPIATAPTGELRWPLDPEPGSAETASDAAGLSVRGEVSWEPVMAVSEEHGPIDAPGMGAGLDDFREWAAALVGPILAEEVDPNVLAYRGHRLAPVDGVARAVLEGEAKGEMESVAVQVALLAVLREMGFRMDRLDAARAQRLAKIAEAFREVAALRGEELAELEPFVSQLERLRTGWAALGMPNATRVSAQRQVEDLSWLTGGKVGAAARKEKDAPAAEPAPVDVVAEPVAARARSTLRTALLFGLPALVFVLSVVSILRSFRAADQSDPLAGPGAAAFQDLFELERIRIEGTLMIAVPVDWEEIQGRARYERMTTLCLRAVDKGFTGVRLDDPRGDELAHCDGEIPTVIR